MFDSPLQRHSIKRINEFTNLNELKKELLKFTNVSNKEDAEIFRLIYEATHLLFNSEINLEVLISEKADIQKMCIKCLSKYEHESEFLKRYKSVFQENLNSVSGLRSLRRAV